MKKTVIGILMMIIAISGIIYWETLGREKLLFSEILVFNQEVQPHTEITAEMLSKRSVYMPQEAVIDVSQAGDIIGMVCTQYIPRGAELFSEYFLQPELNVDEKSDELVFSLETAKLVTFPRSIKKGDRIHIYCKNMYVTDTVVLRTMDGISEIHAGAAETEEGGRQIETIEVKVDERELMKLSELLSEDESLSVAYN